MKILAVVVTAVALVWLLVFSGDYNALTTKPERFVVDYEIPELTSHVYTDISVNYDSIEKRANDYFSQPYRDSGKGEFDREYRAKTKNPLYDPNKWIKTKNPLYNPTKWLKRRNPAYNKKKWIKAGPLKTKNPLYNPTKWLKTKNPLYNPNKWIKTKNPAYNPSEWLYADVVQIEIGYDYSYSVMRRGDITFAAVDENRLEIKIPLQVEGDVGFRGDIAHFADLDKKNVEAAVDVTFGATVAMTDDWCPAVDPDLDIDWQSGPKLEIVGGVWLNLELPAALASGGFEKEMEQAIQASIDCDLIRSQVADTLEPTAIDLGIEGASYYLNIEPHKVYSTGIVLGQDSMSIGLGAEMEVGVAKAPVSTSVNSQLPPLEILGTDAEGVNLYLPVELPYDMLSGLFEQNRDGINEAIAAYLESSQIDTIEALDLKSLRVYPHGTSIGIDLGVSVKAARRFFDTRGHLFLTAQPILSEDYDFSLQDIKLALNVDNDLYPVLATIFQDAILSRIEEMSSFNMSDSVEAIKTAALQHLEERMAEFDYIDISVDELSVDLSRDLIPLEEALFQPIVINASVAIEVDAAEMPDLRVSGR